MANTGNLIQPQLKYVTDDVNEYPLDVNGVRTSISGLPQATAPNPTDSPSYKVLNTTACPVDPSEEVTLTVTGTYNTGTESFIYNGGLSSALTENLTFAFTVTYREDGGEELVAPGDTDTITAGNTIYTDSIFFPVSGVVSDIVVTITYVTPNPNGGKVIVY